MRLPHKAFASVGLVAVALSTGGGFVKRDTKVQASQGPVLQGVTIGPLTWGYTRFCNKQTLVLRDEGALGFTRVVGTNDRCGASQAAATYGSLHLNPDGTAGLGFVIEFSAFPLHENCVLDTRTGNGTCIDHLGRSSGFVLGGLSAARTDQLPSMESH